MEKFRTQVFKRAYEIKKETGKAWAVCLSKAWQLYSLAKKMRNEIITFYYEKKDGSLRKAKGTLKDEVVTYTSKGGASSPKVFTYYDIEVGAFRAFKVANFIK
ncbi:SH3 beta-barrel fold-containing protein [Riemerella anatipestifer]|uniref:SH3 beta-barrel fold-containing protein n=1 Tax=Riemerella anatipestifer TaxID=34085 RepID=UPI0012B37E15|nr:SH3 beta-barrel fold-containing protein [Riemerella anatipestifer]MDY3350917.1 SH3 beta-barrel fold-containing protein [Riemerella anatipestifer]MDY3391110.1 SH3 beta-barrel fold-containing protein [Riemerella anatipestifer]MSN85654.1 DUF2693 domain-containing protein [Riemerella anatipestifer]WFS32970.1 SH3 beta-barrel fold-containing protein [Riemerella anatipestifer]